MSLKYDQDKPRWDLLPIEPIEEVVKALTYGANKYADNNWKTVEPFVERYYAAMMRHIVEWRKGNLIDAESGLSHLTHAMCCMLFLMTKEVGKKQFVKVDLLEICREKPRPGDVYYYIGLFDKVETSHWTGDQEDYQRCSQNNCFLTEKECREALKTKLERWINK